jgi:hypothetical protein
MAERARSVVDALVQSRLPTVLYVGRGANPSAVDALAQVATRLVVDSAEHGVSRSHALARMTTAHLVDMAFLRGRRWREMLARFFDDPSLLPALRDVRSLEVTTFGPAAGHGRADAELVIGWLGSRLGWTLESGAFLGPSGAGVDVQLQVSTEERAGGPVLSSVTLKAELDGAPLVGRVVREDDEHLKWTLESGRAPALCRHPGWSGPITFSTAVSGATAPPPSSSPPPNGRETSRESRCSSPAWGGPTTRAARSTAIT